MPTEGADQHRRRHRLGPYRLKAGGRRKVLVLLSDGEHNVPPPALKPRQAAQLAGNLDVPIYVIDAGGEAAGAEGSGEDRCPPRIGPGR